MKRVVNKMIAVVPVDANRVESSFLDIVQNEGDRPIAGKIIAIGDLVTPGKYEVGQSFVFNQSGVVGPFRDAEHSEFWLLSEDYMYYEL